MLCEYGCNKEANFKLKNGKSCCSDNVSKCDGTKNKISKTKQGKTLKYELIECEFCGKKLGKNTISRHKESCLLNPKNIEYCLVCDKPITTTKGAKTCSKSCSNKIHKVGVLNPNYIGTEYTNICFFHNERKCTVCGEDKVIDVHHLDGNRSNNDVDNLIPLCPTHHRYMHSGYESLIKDKVGEWKRNIKKVIELFKNSKPEEIYLYRKKMKWV